jgi:hypothetical protein
VKHLACAALLLYAAVAGAQTVHKCTVDGKVSYSQQPCTVGTASVIAVPEAPAADPATAAELKRMRREGAALEKDRHKREQSDEREAERAGRAAAARHQKCEKLKLDKKWADDDLRRAQPQYEERARLKAQRATDKVKLSCGS